MQPKRSDDGPVEWMGSAPEGVPPTRAIETGELWFGRHAADRDVLVLDPSQADPDAERLCLYSLSQHRMRVFPREVVLQHIHALTDGAERERARSEYDEREARRREHAAVTAAAAARRAERGRAAVVAAHRMHLARLEIGYAGVTSTDETRPTSRRVRCHECGTPIDDFAGAACAVCGGVLCSCGACDCGAPRRGRKRPPNPGAGSDAPPTLPE